MYICSSCKNTSLKWAGKCPHCLEWNTLSQLDGSISKGKTGKIAHTQKIESFQSADVMRFLSLSNELDRVLGGGLFPGSLVLLSGEPGIGKSTLALQMAEWYAKTSSRSQIQKDIIPKMIQVLYVTGEEHIGQISARANRLGVSHENIDILSETNFDTIYTTIQSHGADIVIIDSISVLGSEMLEGVPGSITQIRLMAEKCMELAKVHKKSLILIGHVTKDGSIGGPKSLEHLVDVVLYLEGVRTENYRILRALKNRFGPTDDVGLFRMEEDGLHDISNPGMDFIDSRSIDLPGTALTFTIEGNRPILIEMEALTTYTKFGYPKRSSRGVSSGKLDLLIAIMSKFTPIKLENYDVYINVSRGLSISEPGVDLACLAALISAKTGKTFGRAIFLGEASLTGVIKNTYFLEKRIIEAVKLGFDKIILPDQYSGTLPDGPEYIKITKIENLVELF